VLERKQGINSIIYNQEERQVLYMEMIGLKLKVRFNAVQMLAMSFAGLILLGTGLLSLPVASKSGESIPFINALLTATSASCVTGLVAYDTYTQFTGFGQAVILCLIQIGGLSFITVSMLVSMFLGRKIGVRQRVVLMDTVGALQVRGIVRLARRVLAVTLAFEGLGALVLAFWFCPRYGLPGIWLAVFHAVSAFCNAGFDLFGTGSSLTTVAGEPLLNFVLIVLILAGGLGFLVWDDLMTNGLHMRRWRLHSKLVLAMNFVLIVFGTIGFYCLERKHAFAGAPEPQKWMMALFQAVAPRTAGFNTVDLLELQDSSTLLTMLLMFIGAGSGSTGGGVKVTTVAVLLIGSWAQIFRKTDVNVFDRRLDEENIRKAYSTVTLYCIACAAGSMVLCVQGVSMADALYEAISALSTVGLTRGVTAGLPVLSKLMVILLMFLGRAGSMSVLMAMTRDRPQSRLRHVPEKILIG